VGSNPISHRTVNKQKQEHLHERIMNTMHGTRRRNLFEKTCVVFDIKLSPKAKKFTSLHRS
jgi:hypothetical protein